MLAYLRHNVSRAVGCEQLRSVVLLFFASLAYRVLHYLFLSDRIVASSDLMQNQLLAERFAAGDFYHALDPYWPPLYAVLLGSVTFVVDDLILPAVIVSMVAGSLIASVTYLLARPLYGQRVGLIAGTLALFYPFFLNVTFTLGNENLYSSFIIGSLICAWRAFTQNSLSWYFATGLLLALAYLTRPEAIGYLILFSGFAAVDHVRVKERSGRRLLMRLGILFVGFLLLSAPYLVYLKQETGSWTVSNKVAVNLAGGVMRETEGRQSAELTSPKVSSRKILQNLTGAERLAQTIIQDIVPIFLFIFISLGLFGDTWSTERLFRELFLIAFCVLTVLGYVVTFVLERYFYVLLPVFLGWMGMGIVVAERWFFASVERWDFSSLQRIKRLFVRLCVGLVFLYMFSVNFYVRSSESVWQGWALEERDAGVWLRENGKPSASIFSASFRPVFYARGKQVWTEAADSDEIMEHILRAHVDYVVVSERLADKYPLLNDLSFRLITSNQFELIYERNDYPGYMISIYRPRCSDAEGNCP